MRLAIFHLRPHHPAHGCVKAAREIEPCAAAFSPGGDGGRRLCLFSRALSAPTGSSCRKRVRSKATFFIGHCRSTRTLCLKDRRDGLRIQRTHRLVLTPTARRREIGLLRLRYRPSTPS